MQARPSQTIQELVQKYNRAGPRYTSYPTAPSWSDRYGPEDYIEALEASSEDRDEPLSLYIHIPFCRKLCWFCGCNKVITNDPNRTDVYLDRIEKELALVLEHLDERLRVSQIHWGGGTPSLMSDEQTRRSFDMLARSFDILDTAEVAMELDPRTTDRDKIQLLKSLGFNRISFGVQDLDKDVQRAINRDQTEEETVDLFHYSRDEGFSGINLDLVYGLPRQNVDEFRVTVEKIVSLRPDRVALYSYAHIPEVLEAQKLFDESVMPKADEKFAMFQMAQQLFFDGGYVQIGMDHFVLPDDELAQAMRRGKLKRNFMGYTVDAARDWIGLGMSSISYIDHNFAQNLSKINEYQTRVDEGRLCTYRGMKLSKDDLIRQFVIAELMCNFQVDLAEVDKRFQIQSRDTLFDELSELQGFVDDGLLEQDKMLLRITKPGRNFVRNIAMTFDGYLKAREDKSVHFSKTI